MPLNRKYFSASSGTLFVECPAKWATNYDDERNVRSRNDYSDVGSLVHRAMELWRDPVNNNADRSFELLLACFEHASVDYTFAEPLGAYKRGRDLLAAAYNMSIYHPTIPIQMMQVIAVEQELLVSGDVPWQMPSWIQPVRGQIDTVGIIPALHRPENEIILFIEDLKTGRPKTHDVLTNEDIQAPLYFLYARDVLVPYLESQQASNGEAYKVTRIVGSWTYVGDGTAVPLYESDFDHKITEDYVANLQRQMREFENKYNAFFENHEGCKVCAAHTGDETDCVEHEYDNEEAIQKFLVDYEKPNPYCSYCPRKNQCQTFSRLLKYENKVDLTGPNINWDAIYEELVAYQAIEKNAKSRVQDIKDLIPVYLDQEKLESIPLSNGKELVANPESRKRYILEQVIDILGKEFVLHNASVTDTAIKRELDLISSTDPERAKQLAPLLNAAAIPFPYSRPVRARSIEAAAKKARKK